MQSDEPKPSEMIKLVQEAFDGLYGCGRNNRVTLNEVEECFGNLISELEGVLASRPAPAASPKVDGETSDGYHTFNELYDHRCLLWILWLTTGGYPLTYRVPDHYEGWDLLGAETEHGQISYHVPTKYRHLYEARIPLADDGYKWDGHTSADVIKRLEATIAGSKLEERGGE